MMKRLLFILFFLFSITACAPVKVEPTATYIFSHSNKPMVSSKRTSLTLLVAAPKAAPGYDTARMAYIDRTYQLNYFSKNRWVDQPERMLKPLLIRTLEETKRFQAVVSLPYPGNVDVRLDTELLNLSQDFTRKPTQMNMVLRAQLINMHTQHVVATREFTFSEPAQPTPYGGVIATNRILARLLPRLGAFVAQSASHVPQRLKLEK